jgi:hypothetical protein
MNSTRPVVGAKGGAIVWPSVAVLETFPSHKRLYEQAEAAAGKFGLVTSPVAAPRPDDLGPRKNGAGEMRRASRSCRSRRPANCVASRRQEDGSDLPVSRIAPIGQFAQLSSGYRGGTDSRVIIKSLPSMRRGVGA